jgi:hypothetical protein
MTPLKNGSQTVKKRLVVSAVHEHVVYVDVTVLIQQAVKGVLCHAFLEKVRGG